MPYLSGFPRTLFEPDDRFIKRVIAKTIVGPYSPKVAPITKGSKVAALGSCFAGEIAKFLRARSVDVQDFYMDEHWNSAFALNFFLGWLTDESDFPKQIRNMLRLEPESHAKMKADFAQADVFIFTFGLSLCWFDKQGALALQPEDVEGIYSRERLAPVIDALEMRQTSVDENERAILSCVERARLLCPKATIVLTLSPVPLLGTVTEIASVPANCISKATLRLALEKIRARNLNNVYYWPSYEIVMWYGAHVARAFGEEGRTARHVRQNVIDLIADSFFSFYVEIAAN